MKYYKTYPAGDCGNIHNLHLEELGTIIPTSKSLYLTMGAIYENDKNLYNVTEDQDLFKSEVLKISGIGNNGQKSFNYHAWITLDSGEILDLAHFFTLAKVYKRKKLLKPIFGTPQTVLKKHNLKYVPYYISGHITQRRYGIKDVTTIDFTQTGI